MAEPRSEGVFGTMASVAMTLHMIRPAVGCNEITDLIAAQKLRRFEHQGERLPAAHTRRGPKRIADLLAGGSLYWIIRGAIRCRQRLVGFENVTDTSGTSWCRILLAPDVVAVDPLARRAMQGWRYLDPGDAPGDLVGTHADGAGMPPEMAAELRELGLL